VLAGCGVAQLLGQRGGAALLGIQHAQADLDLGDPPGDPVVGDGDALGEPSYVVEPQRRVQEGQPDPVRPRLSGRRARYRHAHDRVLQRRLAVHPAPSPSGLANSAPNGG
jgi:hypothetical protein